MADNDTAQNPSDDEVQRAQEVLRMRAEAQAEEQRQRAAPLREITASPEFQKLRQVIEELPAEMMVDMSTGPHLMAMRSGMNGLAIIAPPEPQS